MKKIYKILVSKVRKIINKKYDKSKIPNGLYCFSYDLEKNEKLIDEWDNGIYINACPYYQNINDKFNCCLYDSVITSDEKFKQKNKICNIKK